MKNRRVGTFWPEEIYEVQGTLGGSEGLVTNNYYCFFNTTAH